MQTLFSRHAVFSVTLLSSALSAPFVLLELVNRGTLNEEFPVTLFVFAWVIQTLFLLVLFPIFQSMRSKKPMTKNPIALALRIVALMLLAYIWVGWVVDQWPCLMGVPNCD